MGLGGHGHGHAHDDDDDEEEDNDGHTEGESWFAGGERRYANRLLVFPSQLMMSLLHSGISVQNPDRPGRAVPGGSLVRDLLRRAAE